MIDSECSMSWGSGQSIAVVASLAFWLLQIKSPFAAFFIAQCLLPLCLFPSSLHQCLGTYCLSSLRSLWASSCLSKSNHSAVLDLDFSFTILVSFSINHPSTKISSPVTSANLVALIRDFWRAFQLLEWCIRFLLALAVSCSPASCTMILISNQITSLTKIILCLFENRRCSLISSGVKSIASAAALSAKIHISFSSISLFASNSHFGSCFFLFCRVSNDFRWAPRALRCSISSSEISMSNRIASLSKTILWLFGNGRCSLISSRLKSILSVATISAKNSHFICFESLWRFSFLFLVGFACLAHTSPCSVAFFHLFCRDLYAKPNHFTN